MSNCTIFTENFFQSITGAMGFQSNIDWLKSIIPDFSSSQSGLWQPIVITKNNAQLSRDHYCTILGRPYNIDDYTIPPCECENAGARVARNSIEKFRRFRTYVGEEPENGIFCSYCETLPREQSSECIVELNYTPTSKFATIESETRYWDPRSDEGTKTFTDLTCCTGGCDTRALTDDLSPKIPYLYSNYHTKFSDFKYHKQFPSVINPGIGYDKFAVYDGKFKDLSMSGSVSLIIDWVLEPRLGEISPPLDNTDTYHNNLYSHKKSFKNYLNNNKTCGNFILTKPNSGDAGSISEWQVNRYPTLSGIALISGVKYNSLSASQTIPSQEDFSIPYGIKDKTHWNILLGPDSGKVGGLWKWNISSGIIGWYRYYDKDRENDDRPLPGIDLYISDGDVFFATNDGPEPLAQRAPAGPCKPKSCPSGLKLNDYTVVDTTGTMTIVPSGSDFIYISCNLYDKVYSYMNRLIFYHKNSSPSESLLYKDLLEQSAILASGPQFDDVTVDLFTSISGYSPEAIDEFVDTIIKEHIDNEKTEDQIDAESVAADIEKTRTRDDFGRDLENLKNLTNKEMFSYNGINFIRNNEDLVNTLAHKYGAYLFIPKDTEASITLENAVLPHISIDINFDPVVRYRDTFNSTNTDPKSLTCSSVLRSNTQVFGYDQSFSVGEAKLYSKILEDKLVYNALCSGDPPTHKITDVSSTMSVYANDERIFTQSVGNYQTSFSDIYSRFPSVSSTLDDTFQSLDLITDEFGTENVYTLKNDAQLRLNRSYRAMAAHAGIDIVAFHEDGGFFYDSIMLNKYPGTGTVAFVKGFTPKKKKSFPVIGFKTYDVGIKLYDMSVSHLRSPDKLACKTMPLDQSCKCWGLDVVENYVYNCDSSNNIFETPNLYTPYLSTASNPLKAYGGYSQQEVEERLGSFVIPGHPEPSSKLSLATKIIDMDKIFGCKETASITLSTLLQTDWTIKLPDWDFDNANLWIYIDDPEVLNDRNAVVLLINDEKLVYPNTQVNLGDSLDQELSLKLLNIALDNVFEGIEDDARRRIYHPNLFTCSSHKINYYGVEPNLVDKVRFVEITFARVPFQTKPVFSLPTIKSLGQLTETSFDPNKGLPATDSSERGTAITFDTEGLFSFDYGSRLFNNGLTVDDNEYRIFKGTISSIKANSLGRYLSLLDHSRKPRLYLLINNSWYEYEEHRSFGYYNTQENLQYYGWPTIFSEHHLSPVEPVRGPFIPAIPKTPLEYMAFVNDQSWIRMSAIGKQGYPYSNMLFFRDPDNDKKIFIEGSRAYFRFASDDDEQTYKLFNEDKIKYKEEFTPDILGYTDTVASPIYTFESAKIKSTQLTEEQINNPYDTSLALPNTVVAKSIGMNLLPFYTGGTINRHIASTTHNNLYTILELEQPIPYKRGYIVADINNVSLLNFTAFATTNVKNMVGINQVITPDSYKPKESFSSKWSDVHYYSSPDMLNNQIMSKSINDVYVPSMYPNTLSQLISNNFFWSKFRYNDNAHATGDYTAHWLWLNKSGTFLLDINLNDINNEYYIHRAFSIDEKKARYPYTRDKFNLYRNENGLIDINLSSSNIYDDIEIKNNSKELFRGSLWDGKGKGNTGLLCFSGLYRPSYVAPPSGLTTTGVNFFVALNNNFRLKPVPIRNIDNSTDAIYSDSFIIHDTYDVYAGMKLTTEINTDTDFNCDNIISPNLTVPNILSVDNKFDWGRFSKSTRYGPVYATYDILCDIDTGEQCDLGEQAVTGIGKVTVQSKYFNYKYKYKEVSSLSNPIQAFALSVDAGTYGGLFAGVAPYISRATFEEYSALSPTITLLGTSECVDGLSYPSLEKPLSPWDPVYQNEISSNSHPDNLLSIDTWANEILFRALYGSKEPIGYQDISKHSSSNRLDNDAILKYLISNPDNNIQFVYDNIPMDYDRGATANNLSVQGTIQIFGVPKVGDRIKFVYNNEEFDIDITEDERGVYAEVPKIKAKGVLFEKYESNFYYYLREANSDTTVVDDEYTSTTEVVVGKCSTAGNRSVNGSCVCGAGETHLQALFPYCYADFPCFKGCINYSNEWNPSPRGNGWPSCSNPNPCSAFPIVDINSNEHSSPVDQGFARYALTTALGGLCASENFGYECGNWSVHTGGGSNCCSDGKDFKVEEITYNIKSCHYSFTFKAIVENSIANIGELEFINSDPITDCAEESAIAYVVDGPYPKFCDCNTTWPIVRYFENTNWIIYNDCLNLINPSEEIFKACRFTQNPECCRWYCLGETWDGPKKCPEYIIKAEPINWFFTINHKIGSRDCCEDPPPGLDTTWLPSYPGCGRYSSFIYADKEQCDADFAYAREWHDATGSCEHDYNSNTPETRSQCVPYSYLQSEEKLPEYEPGDPDWYPPLSYGACGFAGASDVTEQWVIEDNYTEGVKWEIVQVESTRPSSTYKPACNTLIGTIIFDNFQLRMNIGVAQIRNGVTIANGGNCLDKPITSCPSLKIVLPNNLYGVSENTDTSCNRCKPVSNIISIVESSDFDLVTETRYCILSTYSDFPGFTYRLTDGVAWECIGPFGTEEPYTDWERSCNKPFDSVRMGGTAYSDWHYFVPHTMSAIDSLEAPEKSACETEPVLNNMKLISVSAAQSDPETASKMKEAWQSNIEELFGTKSWCFNEHNFNLDDLIEGAIPGSCSLEYANGSLPVYGVRSTRTLVEDDDTYWKYDSEVNAGTINITVAYIKYEYVRPITIQDKFIEKYKPDIEFTQCATFFGPAPKNNTCSPTENLKEEYKSTESKDSNCLSNPECYDTVRGCAPEDLCCQNNLKKE